MSWKEKISNINDLFIYCRNWRTKNEIAEQFGLTPIEAWHCIKFARALNSEFETKRRVGITRKAYAIRTRSYILKEIGYLK